MPDHLLQEDGSSFIEIEGGTTHLILESSTGTTDTTDGGPIRGISPIQKIGRLTC